MEGYTVKGLSVETNLPSGVVGRLTHELNRMHLLVFDRTNEDAAVRFAPAEDINHLTVKPAVGTDRQLRRQIYSGSHPPEQYGMGNHTRTTRAIYK